MLFLLDIMSSQIKVTTLIHFNNNSEYIVILSFISYFLLVVVGLAIGLSVDATVKVDSVCQKHSF